MKKINLCLHLKCFLTFMRALQYIEQKNKVFDTKKKGPYYPERSEIQS
jgi:hypothetical protein